MILVLAMGALLAVMSANADVADGSEGSSGNGELRKHQKGDV
jgi:hypothetical protein